MCSAKKHPDPMPVLMLSEIMGVEENEVGDLAVLDTGASRSFISAAAAEKVVANMAEGTYTVETNERASFRFADGETGICSSVLKIHETSDLPEMSFAVMETKEGAFLPPLIGAEWLFSYGAVIEYDELTLAVTTVSGTRQIIPISKARNGHLLMKLRNKS